MTKQRFWYVLFFVLVPQWQPHLTTIPTSLSTSLLVSTRGTYLFVVMCVCMTAPPNQGLPWVLLAPYWGFSGEFCVQPQSLTQLHTCSKSLAADNIKANAFCADRIGAVWSVASELGARASTSAWAEFTLSMSYCWKWLFLFNNTEVCVSSFLVQPQYLALCIALGKKGRSKNIYVVPFSLNRVHIREIAKSIGNGKTVNGIATTGMLC